nr:vancomycin resistance histidine kinase VanS [uncultured Schaedlerella sp.]
MRTTLFVRTILLLITDAVLLLIFSDLYLFGRFANFMVGILNRFIYHDYDRALEAYQLIFRNRLEWFWLMGLFAVFLASMWIYLRNFTKYFYEINRGIDALIEENPGEVILSPELSLTERKINHIRHTLERRKSEAAVAEQRKNDLVVYLAHDLKTPLTSVIGYLTLLRDEKQLSEELREKYLSISLEKAERLEDLINEFFEITRFNLSSITLEYSSVNLTRLLEQLTYEFQPMLSEKNLTYSLEMERDMTLRCDVDQMQRVLDNLLRNAVNYSFEGGTIRIGASQEGEYMKIRFSNRGNTIPKEKLERIFEQFYRLDTARSSRSGGAGLGLAIAKEIVELHQGSITARSEDERIEFEVTLPCGKI